MPRHRLIPAPNRTEGSDGDQNVEAEDGRRQYDGQRDDRFYQKFPALTGKRQPVGERNSDYKQNDRNRDGQSQRQSKCLQDHCGDGTRKPYCCSTAAPSAELM